MSAELAAAALVANQAFYDAFAAGDMGAMEEIWAKDASCACAHPGAPLLIGRETVLESWATILAAPQRPEIECFNPIAHVLGDSAYVTCYERLGPGAVLLATNVLVKEQDGRWRMAHHHASPTPMAPPRPKTAAADKVIH